MRRLVQRAVAHAVATQGQGLSEVSGSAHFWWSHVLAPAASPGLKNPERSCKQHHDAWSGLSIQCQGSSREVKGQQETLQDQPSTTLAS